MKADEILKEKRDQIISIARQYGARKVRLNRKVDVVTEAALSPYIREEILRQVTSL